MAVAKTGGLLSGNILAGASWNSLNSALPEQLTAATGQATSNYAVGGATTADTLNQLNTFIANGGAFDPNATVFLQTGGVDFLQGIDKATIKDNINQIVKTLGDQGVNVVLTGSPYAASVQDVIDNNFDPKVDPLFNEIAKENKNVALVGTQGEILQNKKLLVDALHTNAEGTAIYNQSVIDALSQFKNDVPSSAPQDIAQVQKTNTVATTPPAITQAASSPVVAQTLATETVDSLIKAGNLNPTQIAAATGVPVGEIVTKAAALAPFQGSTKLGDTYVSPNYSYTQSGEETIVGGLESIGTSKVSSEQGSRTELYSPTGELTNVGKYDKGPSFFGGLADAFNDPVVQAAFLGLGGGGAIGNALGLTGSTAQAVGTGLFKGGAAAAGGADLSDALKVGLLSGGLVYGGNELTNAIKYQDVPVDFTNMTQDQINDALDVNFRNDLARTGMSDAQIKSFLANPASVYDATQAVTTPTAVTTPVTEGGTVAVTAPTTPSLSNVLSTIASTTPTVNVTTPKAPQQVDQAVIDLVNSQIASNVKAPTTANVQVTSQKPITTQDIVNTIAAVTPALITPTTPNLPETVISDKKPSSITDVITTATIPLIQPSTPLTPTEVTAQKDLTTSEQLRLAQLALTAAGLLGAGSALSNSGSGGTQYPIIPVPSDWQSPPKTGVAAATQLPPINFGDRNLLIGTQWEKFLDPNYGKVPEPVQYSQPSNLSYNDLMGILGSKQGMPPASSLSINDIISGIQNQYAPANVPISGSNYRSNLANVNTGANATMLPSSVMQTIAGTGANTGVSAVVPTSTKTGGNTIQNIINTIQGVPTQTGSVANAGMFQKVYDPTTGREFNSPAQAAQYGVTNYVTEMPFNRAFMQTVDDTTKNTIDSLMAKGQTFEQALDSIGSRFGMTGKQFYNSEVQGGLNYADQQVTRGAVATESGGLSPNELISKLEAYKAKPPTTAQEFADQRALYADYANRYANSSWNYANMGGKPQDFSLKPAEFLPTSYTGYVDPINQYLSSTNQMTPTFTKMQDILSQKPDINLAFQNVLAANPNAFTGGNNIIEATINNLSSAIDTNGLSSALRNFYKDQQNLIGFGSPDYKQIQNMSNPQYAALQKQIMDQTQRVDDTAWNTMAQGSIGRNKIDNIWRDPVSGLGIGTGQSGLMYFDRDGRPLSVSGGVDLAQNAAKYGIDTSGFTGLAKTI